MPDKTFVPTLLACELACILIWFLAGSYSTTADGTSTVSSDYDGATLYHFWIGVHIMMLLGFGGLMQFLHRHGYASIGETFLITCLGIQVSIICYYFWQGILSGTTIKPSLGVADLFQGDFGVAAVLITMGAVLGKVSSTQLIFITVIEIFFYALSNALVDKVWVAADPGGSIVIHAFGGYFGLSLSKVVTPPRLVEDGLDGNKRSSYVSDLFAMLGTLFLFIYWPSFNAGPLSTDANGQERAIVNTVFALAGSALGAFAFSRILRENHFSMEDIQNATLAGGVAVGSTCTMMIGPGGALTIGVLAGSLSTIGFAIVEPFLARTINLQDTCGVHNLHAVPGALGGLASVIVAWAIPASAYGGDIGSMYEGREKYGRTGGEQAFYQLAALLSTISIAIVTGYLTGKFITGATPALPRDFLFMDDAEWEMPDHGHMKKGGYDAIESQDEKAHV